MKDPAGTPARRAALRMLDAVLRRGETLDVAESAAARGLLPAFAPPTWSVIVLYGLNSDLPLPGIVATGALAAACGRFALALRCNFP